MNGKQNIRKMKATLGTRSKAVTRVAASGGAASVYASSRYRAIRTRAFTLTENCVWATRRLRGQES